MIKWMFIFALNHFFAHREPFTDRDFSVQSILWEQINKNNISAFTNNLYIIACALFSLTCLDLSAMDSALLSSPLRNFKEILIAQYSD